MFKRKLGTRWMMGFPVSTYTTRLFMVDLYTVIYIISDQAHTRAKNNIIGLIQKYYYSDS